jgi:uncharacterized protein YprB with RNaseH-like and TPR domain
VRLKRRVEGCGKNTRDKLRDVDGYVAVQLWWEYVNNNNKQALRTLLEYNAEDVVNLRVLRRELGVR